MHQPNKYMLQSLEDEIEDEKVPHSTQSIYGNQNSASIPGTINGFLGNVSNSHYISCRFWLT